MGIDGQQLQWLIGGYTHLLLKLRYLLINYAENLFFLHFFAIEKWVVRRGR